MGYNKPVGDEPTKSDDDCKVNRSSGQTEKYLNPGYAVINTCYDNHLRTLAALPVSGQTNARPYGSAHQKWCAKKA
jgi:hypothetical protein